MDLFKRPILGRKVEFQELLREVQIELGGSSSNLGYLSVWTILKDKGLLIKEKMFVFVYQF